MLTSCVPGAEEVDAAGEEAGLEDTEKRSQTCKSIEVLDEAHGNCDGAPEEGDEGEVKAGADGAADDGRGRLEDDVCDEEDEVGNILPKPVSQNNAIQFKGALDARIECR